MRVLNHGRDLSTGGQVKRTHKSRLGWSRLLILPGLALGVAVGCGGNGGSSSEFDGGLGGGGDGGRRDGTTDGRAADSQPSLPDSAWTSDARVGGEACAASTKTADVSPLDMYIVLDRSGSMADNDAWSQEIQALTNFVGDYRSAGLGVGIQYMPLPDLCDPVAYATPAVPITVLPAGAGQIITSLSGSRPYGGTPTVPALEGAVMAAKARQKSNPGRDIVIVLSTDGLPDTSCSAVADGGLPNSTQNAIAVLQAAASAVPPIKTFVIGIGSQSAAFNAMAAAGGTTPILVGEVDGGAPVDIEAPLINALAAIRANALPCEYTIPQASAGTIDYNQVNVTFVPTAGASQPFFAVNGAANCQTTTNDWYYDNPTTPKHIELCPAACTMVKASTNGTVNVVYGCEQTVYVGPK